MKRFKNHMVLVIIAILSTNVFFVMAFLFNDFPNEELTQMGCNLCQLTFVTNLSLLVIASLSYLCGNWGDRILTLGYSNFLRGLVLIENNLFKIEENPISYNGRQENASFFLIKK